MLASRLAGCVSARTRTEDAFYAGILMRLIPRELTGKDGEASKHKVTVVVKRDEHFFDRGRRHDPSA
jgi:hypothetical protein